MAQPKTSKSIDALINQALAIEAEAAHEAGALGFMARAMVQATLPHRKVEGTYFERKNGAYTLSMLASPKVGLPFGSIPRLLLAWTTTEAVRTKSRELELGDSMSAFMAELGLKATGGANGSITRLKEQSRRLFAATVSATYEDSEKVADIGFRLTDKTMLWWHAKDIQQASLWKSSITLSQPFFDEIVSSPVPIDMRALRALKQSPLALDLYCWLTYRASYAKKASTIPWAALALQFGADYSRLRDFKAAFLQELRKVVTVFGAVQIEAADEGLIVRPSLTHIPKKASE